MLTWSWKISTNFQLFNYETNTIWKILNRKSYKKFELLSSRHWLHLHLHLKLNWISFQDNQNRIIGFKALKFQWVLTLEYWKWCVIACLAIMNEVSRRVFILILFHRNRLHWSGKLCEDKSQEFLHQFQFHGNWNSHLRIDIDTVRSTWIGYDIFKGGKKNTWAVWAIRLSNNFPDKNIQFENKPDEFIDIISFC